MCKGPVMGGTTLSFRIRSSTLTAESRFLNFILCRLSIKFPEMVSILSIK
jgi:hypothetical protein